MNGSRSFLGGRSAGDFLANYWQKQPLLIRRGVEGYDSPVDGSDLLGLACEHDVESRLVQFENGTWRLTPGPFAEEALSGLGPRDWTILVSDLEEHVPSTRQLLSNLDFLPTWRVDDIMASFAVAGGSVGPHFDSYDVFLVQVAGTRRWRISTQFDETRLRTDTELCILAEFVAEEEWELEPGDVLYLPPNVAHFGVATSPCMTFSLGCRAPTLQELVTQVARDVIERTSTRAAYRDPNRAPSSDPYRLDTEAVTLAKRQLADLLPPDDEHLARSFGKLVTRPKALFAQEFDLDELEPMQLEQALDSDQPLARRQGSRWLYLTVGAETFLFANELELRCPDVSLARELCQRRHFSPATWRSWKQNEVREGVLRDLVRWGLLIPQQSTENTEEESGE